TGSKRDWSSDVCSSDLIGTGRIGSIVGKIFAEGFGSEVVAYDIESQASCEAYLTYKESMSEAIKDADIVTVHIPATKENTYLFKIGRASCRDRVEVEVD